jgi:hypothetical protein
MPEQPKPLKHVMFWELCFGPMCPSSMFLHAIPIHAPYHFRPFSIFPHFKTINESIKIGFKVWVGIDYK